MNERECFAHDVSIFKDDISVAKATLPKQIVYNQEMSKTDKKRSKPDNVSFKLDKI